MSKGTLGILELMLPYQSDGNDGSTHLFYDLSASKIHKLDLPETCAVFICGSSHGWLVLHKVMMYNLNNPSRTLLGGGIALNDMSLVEGVSGDILLIFHGPTYDVDGVVQEDETNYTVYKLSKDEESKWIEVTDVGQNVLFLGGNYRVLSLSSANLQLPEWGANYLCYDSVRTEQWNWQESYTSWYNHNIKLARLDDRTVTGITGDLGSFQVNRHWQKSL